MLHHQRKAKVLEERNQAAVDVDTWTLVVELTPIHTPRIHTYPTYKNSHAFVLLDRILQNWHTSFHAR